MVPMITYCRARRSLRHHHHHYCHHCHHHLCVLFLLIGITVSSVSTVSAFRIPRREASGFVGSPSQHRRSSSSPSSSPPTNRSSPASLRDLFGRNKQGDEKDVLDGIEDSPKDTTDQIDTTTETTADEKKLNRNVEVSASLEVPFSAEKAYDTFSDLEKQANWSTWLRKVEYTGYADDSPENGSKDDTLTNTNGNRQDGPRLKTSKWSAGMRGFSWSWRAVQTEMRRPHVVAWKSTSGVRNNGRVEFERKGPNTTKVSIHMTLEAPRFVAAFFRRSNKLSNFIEKGMLQQMLNNFRDEVVEEMKKEGGTKVGTGTETGSAAADETEVRR